MGEHKLRRQRIVLRGGVAAAGPAGVDSDETGG
jgi:hypothetical protein